LADEQNRHDADGAPRYQYQGGTLFLDKEGRWFHEGEEITHKLTAELFSRSVCKDPAGGYHLVVGQEWSPIEVEDTPFMVRQVDLTGNKAIARLNDGSEEDLDLSTLKVGAENVLYCEVKAGQFPARFLRPAYYQLMERLVEDDEGFAVEVGGRRWPIYLEQE